MKPIVGIAAIIVVGYVVWSCYSNQNYMVTGSNNLNGRLCVYFGAGAQ
jgi:hypothetical protein